VQLESPIVWKLGVGVALAGTLAWFAASQETTTELVPEIELVEELEPNATDRAVVAAERGAIARVARVFSRLPNESAIDAVIVDGDQTTELGFDLTRRRLDFYGGSGGCSVTLLVYLDDVIGADASCWYTREDWDRVGRFVQRSIEAAELDVTADEHGVRLERSVRYARYAAARARLDVQLGPLTPVHGTADELEAYETLAGIAALTFAHRCGFSGAETPGSRAVRMLMRREDLLRNALHGINPEGRAFAAEALENFGKLRLDDRAAMRALAKLSVRIERCGGCMVFDEASSDVFAQR
jgi:hypothetical protein